MKKLIAISFSAILYAHISIYAQETKTEKNLESPFKNRKHAIGIQLSSIAGIGLNYKYALFDWLHGRVTGMIFPSKSGNLTYTYSNIGTDWQINLFQVALSESIYFRNYVGAAISYWEYNYSSGYISSRLHTGATLGIEFVISSRFFVHGDLGFGYYKYERTESYDTTIAGGLGLGVLF